MFNCNINLFMNKKIITGFLMFALAVFSMSSFVACKDIDEDSYDDLKARINAVSKDQMDLRTALESQIQGLKDAIAKIKSCTCDPSNYASAEDMRNAQRKIDELEKALDKLNKYVHDSIHVGPGGDTVIYVENPYNDSLIWVNINNINDDLAEQLKTINFLNGWIVYVQELAKNDSIRIDGLEDIVLGWDSVLTHLNVNIVHVIDSLINEKIHHDTLIVELDSAYIIKIDSARLIGDSALKIAQKALLLAIDNADRISTLERYLSNLVTREDLASEIGKLNARINSLLDQMVTGIIIQGTESPVIGYFNTPLDVRAQILAAYYGETTAQMEFPSGNTGDYVDASNFLWTKRNKDVLGISDFSKIEGYVDQAAGTFTGKKNGKDQGNAGTVYVTVNPTNVDFTGKTLALETSQGKQAGITLEALKASDRELTFGFSRAAAANGFYEAEATLTTDGIESSRVRIDYAQLEGAAKNMLKEKNVSSVLNFGAALLENTKDVLPAYAVKATWSEKNKAQTYDVLSQYGIAATAIKPFSYAFLKDLNVNLPGEAKLKDLVAQIIDKINVNIDLGLPDFSKYQGKIVFKDIDLSSVTTTVTFTINYTLVDPATGNVMYFLVTDGQYRYYMKDETDPWVFNIDLNQWQTVTWNTITSVPVTINMTQNVDMSTTLQQIIDQINAQFGASSDLAKTITSLLNDIAAMGDLDTKISDAISNIKSDVKSQINNLITSVYNKLNVIFSAAPNKALQPTMIAQETASHKAGILSQSLSMPTKANSALTLVPTSYTLELLAPAYKKYVAVTNVYDATTKAELALADAKSKAASANGGENMNKVIDFQKTCTLAGEVGYIYEVTYSAVDYQGKVVMRKFYVQF
jgi:hypothetical protein